MTKYNIIKWDVIITSNVINPVPVIFIEPDTDFKKLIINNNFVNVDISNSHSVYDDKPITGVVAAYDSSTNLYIITLNCMWYGYPDPLSTGRVEFY